MKNESRRKPCLCFEGFNVSEKGLIQVGNICKITKYTIGTF